MALDIPIGVEGFKKCVILYFEGQKQTGWSSNVRPSNYNTQVNL